MTIVVSLVLFSVIDLRGRSLGERLGGVELGEGGSGVKGRQ